MKDRGPEDVFIPEPAKLHPLEFRSASPALLKRPLSSDLYFAWKNTLGIWLPVHGNLEYGKMGTVT